MNREEAILILQASRPGDEAADPRVAEALAQAGADARLAAWLAGERRWDAAVRTGLKTVPVPVDLKARILAGQKVVRLPVPEREPVLWFRPASIWAMAAVLVFFLGLAYMWNQPRPAAGQLADFARDMIAASPHDAHHVDVLNSNLDQVRNWLGEHHTVADIELPPAIKDAPGLMGCRVMHWRGRQVSMLCFMMHGTEHVDLFVTRADTVADAPAPGQPRFETVDGQIAAGWTTAGNVYLMTGRVPEEFLRHCLDPGATAWRFPELAVAGP